MKLFEVLLLQDNETSNLVWIVYDTDSETAWLMRFKENLTKAPKKKITVKILLRQAEIHDVMYCHSLGEAESIKDILEKIENDKEVLGYFVIYANYICGAIPICPWLFKKQLPKEDEDRILNIILTSSRIHKKLTPRILKNIETEIMMRDDSNVDSSRLIFYHVSKYPVDSPLADTIMSIVAALGNNHKAYYIGRKEGMDLMLTDGPFKNILMPLYM